MRTLLSTFGLLAATSSGFTAGNPREGQTLAQQWCSSCHGRSDAAPSLEAIANRPGRTPYTLRAWLMAPHPPMPNLLLSRNEIDDLVAYIASLATEK